MSRSAIAVVSVLLLLAVMPAIAADNPANPTSDLAVLPTATAATTSEHKIKSKLDTKISIDVADQPLSEWVTFLSDKYHFPIMFDTNALKDAALDPTTTSVGMTVKDISLRSALKLVLSQHNLTYFIQDEVLQITAQDKANACLTFSIYDVRDLVSDANHAPDQNAVTQLTTVITTTLASPTWNTVGGQGTIQPFSNNGICVLVISQTREVHEQIDLMLANLRTFKPQK